MEANEAFAAQAIGVNKGLGWDTSKVNVNGGAIAIGHPIGASGCRVFVSLIHEMIQKRDAATLCIGVVRELLSPSNVNYTAIDPSCRLVVYTTCCEGA